jgi:WD40 repeat protein
VGAVSARRLLALGLVGSALASCGSPTSDRSLGVLRATTATAGAGQDPDGYVVLLDRVERRELGSSGSAVFAPADVGEHRVDLTDVAPNCAVADDSTRQVTVSAADTTEVSFQVTCTETDGSVQFVTRTTGVELDPNGYTVALGGGRSLGVPSNGVYTAALPSGRYPLQLGDATPNCTPHGAPPEAVEVVRGAVTRILIDFDCVAAAPAGRGHEIAFVSSRNGEDTLGVVLDQIFLMNDDGTGLRAYPPVAASFALEPNWTANGETIVFSSQLNGDFNLIFSSVWRLDLASGVPVSLHLGILDDAKVSPDGTRLAFVDNPDPEGFSLDRIVVAPTEGGTEEAVSDTTARSGSPAWSPDGRMLAFVRRGEGRQIVVVTLGERGERPVGPELPAELGPRNLAWSPDGARIAFEGFANGHSHIFVMQLDGTGPRQLTFGTADERSPAWSPDGTRIVLSTDRDGNSEIYVMDADGSNFVRLTNDPGGDRDPAWRP